MAAVEVPWAAWYGDTTVCLDFPHDWAVSSATLPGRPPLDREAIEAALRVPVGGPGLSELVAEAGRIGIVVEDTTRPSPTPRIVSALLEELSAAGVARDRIRLLLGTGAHRPAGRIDAEKKLGVDTVRNFAVHYHDCHANLVSLGKTASGTPLWINRVFAECDVKIAIGTVTPHDFAGFGGGAKVAAVGLAGLETIEATHGRCVDEGGNHSGSLEQTKFRADLEAMAERVGLSFAVNGVVGPRRELVHLTAGQYGPSHAAACRFAADYYRADVPANADIVVLNAYPKDMDLIQATMALNVGFFACPDMVRPGGTVIVTASCPEGAGAHYLAGFEPRDEYRLPESAMLGRKHAFFSDNLTRHELATSMPTTMRLFSRWPEVIAWAADHSPAPPSVTVLTHATLQLPHCSD